jgi:hypothetical protein
MASNVSKLKANVMKEKLSAISAQQSAKDKRIVALCALGLVLMLVKCIPAKVPPNLGNTPGPAVVITDHVYESSQFTARYPDGWKVVTSEAIAPLSVIFVAPDEASNIKLLVGTLDSANFSDPKMQTDVRGITLENGLKITAILSARTEKYETYLPIFEDVLASVKPT